MRRKTRKRIILPVVLIVLGGLLIISAIAAELSQYPWRTLVGLEREAEEIPDPGPIVLSKQDAGIIIVEADEGESPALRSFMSCCPGASLMTSRRMPMFCWVL